MATNQKAGLKIKVNSKDTSKVVTIDCDLQQLGLFALPMKERGVIASSTEVAKLDVVGGSDKLYAIETKVIMEERIDKEVSKCLECPLCLDVSNPLQVYTCR